MTPARFILSLDCEGKWGLADQLTPAHHRLLSDEGLRDAYGRLIALLDEFEIPATFAFVGCFSLSAEHLAASLPALEAFSGEVPGYLDAALDDIALPDRQGWTGDWAVRAVLHAAADHEIALHGATHVPWTWPGMTRDVARQEFKILLDAQAPILTRTCTFVYPRNAVAHLDVLDEFGLVGARGTRSRSYRAQSLAAEFNLLSPPDADPVIARPLQIPAGHFVNWPSGARRIVPAEVTRARARLMLRRARATGRVVHYWTHPENIATAPATLRVLRAILEEVARMRDAGRCDVLTQEAYCRSVDPSHVNAHQPRPIWPSAEGF